MSTTPASPAAPAPAFDGLGEAKRLLRTIRAGALATLEPEGLPFVSLVSVATLIDGRPILLLSQLAAHTRHLAADPRCSLLLAERGKGDPLAHPRLTVSGQAERLGEGPTLEEARARFLSRQPKAGLYADFPDFSFWCITPKQGHLNGGFARAAGLEGADLLTDPGELAAAERGAVAHMNADHRDAVALYGEILAGEGPGAWTMSGLDAEGIDLICGDRVARVNFDQTVSDRAGLVAALKLLAERARRAARNPQEQSDRGGEQ